VSRAFAKWIWLTVACQVGWLGCIRKPPAPPASPPSPPGPPIQVPPGCLADLSGTYVHGQNPTYRYLASDDGGTLFIAVERSRSDAGVPRLDANPVSVSLSRTPKGFIGETQAVLFVATGRACPVDFPTEIIACDDAGLILKSAISSAVDESCQPSNAPAHTVMAEHRLARAPASSLPVPSSADAGAEAAQDSP
jgi:hypothetical protein